MTKKIRQEIAIDSINEHDGNKMDEQAKLVWETLLDNIKDVNFKTIWCQYSDLGEENHIFISFGFKNDIFVDMTRYIDSDFIIFSVGRNNDYWMSNGMPEDIFFEHLIDLPNIIKKQKWQ